MTRIRSFADDILGLSRAARYVRVATLSDAERERLGGEGRRDVLASLIVNAETSHQVGSLEGFSEDDIDAARQQAAAVSFARGEIKIAIAIGSARSFDRLCQAVLGANWEGACKIYELAASSIRDSPEALLLYATAISARDGLEEARPFFDRAVTCLFIGGDVLSASFWGAFELLPADDVLRATVICAVALGAVKRFDAIAFQLIEHMISGVAAKIAAFCVAPKILWPVLEALIQRREVLNDRQLQMVAQHMVELAELVDDRAEAARACDLAARAAFASGRTAQALANQRRRAEHLGLDQERRRASIWSARYLKINEAGSEAYAEVERLDPDTWVAALGDARVISGRSSSGSFHYVCTPDSQILMEGLGADPLQHIGADDSPLRARSPLGDVLVDISARPQPWRMLEPAVLIGGARDDDIWLLEHFPKIDLWRRSSMGQISETAFFIDRQPTSRQKEVLGNLDLGASAIIHSDPYYDRIFDKLYIASAPSLNKAVDFLRKSFLTAEISVQDLVYIHPAWQESEILNQTALLTAMIDHGATILIPEEKAIADVARTLAAAKMVVRWSGAGDAYLAFCSPGSRVVEIVDPRKIEGHRSKSILSYVGAGRQSIMAILGSDANGAIRVNIKLLVASVEEAGYDSRERRS